MSSKPFTLVLALTVLAGCGASRNIGNELPDGGSTGTVCTASERCPQSQTCDYGNVCREYCGGNYPNVVCAEGSTCDNYVCRPKCQPGTANTCPSGLNCSNGVCQPIACGANNPCALREACVAGACQQIGWLCGDGGQCRSGELCDQGVCRVRCGPNYPTTFCASGESCQNAVCRP
jgi:hypothetical protein